MTTNRCFARVHISDRNPIILSTMVKVFGQYCQVKYFDHIRKRIITLNSIVIFVIST